MGVSYGIITLDHNRLYGDLRDFNAKTIIVF